MAASKVKTHIPGFKFDVISIDHEQKVIRFIQAKGPSMPESAKKRLYEALKGLEGQYTVRVDVV